MGERDVGPPAGPIYEAEWVVGGGEVGFFGAGVDALVQVEGLLVVVEAGRVSLLAEYVPGRLFADGEGTDDVALVVGELLGGDGEVVAGLVPVPVEPGVLEAGG